jgi:hypothetical protein
MCALFHTDAHLLEAWAAYWWLLGVEHFYLYYNGAAADIPALQARAAALRGSFHFAHWPFDYWVADKIRPHHGQPMMLNDCFYRNRDRHELLLMYDLDEALVFRAHVDLHAFYDSLGAPIAALRTQSVEDNNRFLREQEELTAQIGALQAASKTAAKADAAELLAARQALAKAEVLIEHWKSRTDYWKAIATGTTVAPTAATQPGQPAPPDPPRPTPPTPPQGARLTPEEFLKGLSDSDGFFWRTDGTRVAFSLLQGLSRESSVTVWKLSANAAVKRPRFDALLQAALGYLPAWEAPLPARDTGPLADWLRAFDKLVSVQMAQYRPERGQSDTAERAATQPSGLGTLGALLEQAKRKG